MSLFDATTNKNIFYFCNGGGGTNLNRIISSRFDNTVSYWPMTLEVGTTEILRLQTSGNVSIGTATDNGYKLDVTGTIRGTAITGSSFAGDGANLAGLNGSNIGSGTVSVARGGTGLNTYTSGDLIYANGTTSLAKLAIGDSGSVLQSNGSTPSWSTALSGVPITMFGAAFLPRFASQSTQPSTSPGELMIWGDTSTPGGTFLLFNDGSAVLSVQLA